MGINLLEPINHIYVGAAPHHKNITYNIFYVCVIASSLSDVASGVQVADWATAATCLPQWVVAAKPNQDLLQVQPRRKHQQEVIDSWIIQIPRWNIQHDWVWGQQYLPYSPFLWSCTECYPGENRSYVKTWEIAEYCVRLGQYSVQSSVVWGRPARYHILVPIPGIVISLIILIKIIGNYCV